MMSESSSEYQELSAYGVMVSYSQIIFQYQELSALRMGDGHLQQNLICKLCSTCAWCDGQLQQNIIVNYVLLYLVEIFTLSTT